MTQTETLDKSMIYTLVGFMEEDNTFTTIEGEIYDCMTYRCNYNVLKDRQLCAVNLIWHGGYIQSWVIFQYVELDEEVVQHQNDATNVS